VRKTLLSLAAVAALAAPSAAQAKTTVPDPPVATTLPTFPTVRPVTVNRVVNVPTAVRFSNAYAARNAARFLGQDRDRVRVTDVLSTCLRSPVSAGQFGCVFALNAAVVTRNSYNYDWDTFGSLTRKLARPADPTPTRSIRIPASRSIRPIRPTRASCRRLHSGAWPSSASVASVRSTSVAARLSIRWRRCTSCVARRTTTARSRSRSPRPTRPTTTTWLTPEAIRRIIGRLVIPAGLSSFSLKERT
jgi:hypothetical protein